MISLGERRGGRGFLVQMNDEHQEGFVVKSPKC
jgi:hypothetical protein